LEEKKYSGSSTEDLAKAIEQGQITVDTVLAAKNAQRLAEFKARFGPEVLLGLNGEQLLRTMHGRQDDESRCLSYWLEFKNDEEFPGHLFGGIGGGSALKFGVFQRTTDAMWISGSPKKLVVLSLDQAITIAERQRDELVAGSQVLARLAIGDFSDATYSQLQSDMLAAAPDLADDGWAHKYWFLCHPEKLDTFHSPRYQRFYLYKMLQLPPDELGTRDSSAPRFNCAGRFVAAAHELSIPVASLAALVASRSGAFHRYWKVGTTEGDTGESRWQEMQKGGFVSIGWPEHVQDLTPLLGAPFSEAKSKVADMLANLYDAGNVKTRKSGEIVNFSHEISENDIVLACEGQTVVGVGKVSGAYRYDETLRFPHLRPVQWLSLERWDLPEAEGPRTTVFELGRKAANLLAIEQHLSASKGTSAPVFSAAMTRDSSLALLDPLSLRVEALLRRKGQLIFYGPPGTGKTYRALLVAEELAARQAFRRTPADLTPAQKNEITGADGLVRTCTFHPGWGYEDFVEGLRPKTINGQMIFEAKDGIFKRLCTDAAARPERHFFLVVDEINRSDLPRTLGELMTVLEADKRGREVILPLSGTLFSIPPNVFLIGTMNTADRSISLLDTALRRRFGFIELMPDSKALVDAQVGGLRLGAWLDAVNSRIRNTLKRDARNLQVGHAYLMPSPPLKSVAEFSRVLRDDIIPLLEEYCYEDFAALQKILGSSLVDIEEGRINEGLFAPQQEESLIQAMQFPEIASLTVDQPITDSALAKESETVDDEDELEQP
jgi:5-methylcytosine-specific restriction enzyme B